SVLAARDGSLWFGTGAGFNRWADGQVTAYKQNHERSSQEAVSSNVREVVVAGLPKGTGALFQDSHGRIWISALTAVGYLENDRFAPIEGIPNGNVNSIVEDGGGNVWIAHYSLGLFQLSPDHRILRRTPWNELGQNDMVYRLAADPIHGGLWLGFSAGRLAYF